MGSSAKMGAWANADTCGQGGRPHASTFVLFQYVWRTLYMIDTYL